MHTNTQMDKREWTENVCVCMYVCVSAIACVCVCVFGREEGQEKRIGT